MDYYGKLLKIKILDRMHFRNTRVNGVKQISVQEGFLSLCSVLWGFLVENGACIGKSTSESYLIRWPIFRGFLKD